MGKISSPNLLEEVFSETEQSPGPNAGGAGPGLSLFVELPLSHILGNSKYEGGPGLLTAPALGECPASTAMSRRTLR